MTQEQTFERIGMALEGSAFEKHHSNDGMCSIVVQREALHGTLEALKGAAKFDALTMITAIDRYGARQAEPRFEVVYQLQSIEHADRVRIRTRLTTEDAKVPTCTDLWSGASFMERECWDLMGIDFEGHPDMRRLLMPDGYGHHPLRKEFPHQGIEPDRLYREWDTARRKEWDAERAAAKQAQAKG